jgi:Domain of unknown function (DUF1980)
MSRGTKNALLLLVGLSTVVMVIKGSYLHYVKPSLLPWLIAAAVVLITLAVASIVRDLRQALDDTDSVDGDGHRHHSWLVWLLLVPIALTASSCRRRWAHTGLHRRPSQRPNRGDARFRLCPPGAPRRCRSPSC